MVYPYSPVLYLSFIKRRSRIRRDRLKARKVFSYNPFLLSFLSSILLLQYPYLHTHLT